MKNYANLASLSVRTVKRNICRLGLGGLENKHLRHEVYLRRNKFIHRGMNMFPKDFEGKIFKRVVSQKIRPF